MTMLSYPRDRAGHDRCRWRSCSAVDVSACSLEEAQREHGATGARFMAIDEYHPSGTIDLAFCNGVFHHIPPNLRGAAVRYVLESLRPGGLFAFWENSPWNPGTRYVMSRIPFDRDAITLTPPEARQLLTDNGFEIVRTDFLFVFPRLLRWFRMLEPRLSHLPLGAQYQVLARRSPSSSRPLI
jgi:SAM-dependent methyltransferase